MTEKENWVPAEDWKVIVSNVPLVSVDLIIKHNGGVLMGLRENEPAKGEWFVPGGTVLKNESLTKAVQRIARAEIGCEVQILEGLGSFEHFYETSEIEDVETKHYVANAFVVEPMGSVEASDNQHSELRVCERPFTGLHPYVEQYLESAELLD